MSKNLKKPEIIEIEKINTSLPKTKINKKSLYDTTLEIIKEKNISN